MKPEQKFYLIIGGKNDLDIDNDSDNWKLAFGRGGVDSRRRVIFDNPGLENRISVFLMISGLLVQLLAKERHLHNVYKPPPLFILSEKGGGLPREVNPRPRARGVLNARNPWFGCIYCT